MQPIWSQDSKYARKESIQRHWRKAGLELTPIQLFTHQSIAELATVATRVTESQTEPEIVNPPPPEADTGDYTAQDFPLLEIDQIELEQILAQL